MYVVFLRLKFKYNFLKIFLIFFIDIDCGSLSPLEHGAILLPENRTTFNIQASYTCHENYTLIGNENRTCLEDGMFCFYSPFFGFCFWFACKILIYGNVEFSWPFTEPFINLQSKEKNSRKIMVKGPDGLQ